MHRESIFEGTGLVKSPTFTQAVSAADRILRTLHPPRPASRAATITKLAQAFAADDTLAAWWFSLSNGAPDGFEVSQPTGKAVSDWKEDWEIDTDELKELTTDKALSVEITRLLKKCPRPEAFSEKDLVAATVKVKLALKKLDDMTRAGFDYAADVIKDLEDAIKILK